jgi:hypothetical protein
MPREKEKVVEVKLDNGQIVKIKVIRPTNRLNSEAQRIGATVWTQCIQDGVMTKQELQRILKEKGIWGKEQEQKEKDITSEIAELEKKLYLNKKKKLKLSEAKNFAIDMRKKRNELRDHIAQRIALEGNTAEALSDNAKFDFLVANCTFYENGNKVYNTLESYQDSADDVAIAVVVHKPQVFLCQCIPLISCFSKPLQCFFVISIIISLEAILKCARICQSRQQ